MLKTLAKRTFALNFARFSVLMVEMKTTFYVQQQEITFTAIDKNEILALGKLSQKTGEHCCEDSDGNFNLTLRIDKILNTMLAS